MAADDDALALGRSILAALHQHLPYEQRKRTVDALASAAGAARVLIETGHSGYVTLVYEDGRLDFAGGVVRLPEGPSPFLLVDPPEDELVAAGG